ncbi:PREDICTED: uncharacterized protein LOC105570318 [Vollenhovia emeryi]|uniref:uncharacterized protein LOC105570318 n=1 Tax=Vollenhovia emeryi TaxID=411798 RepID=UPI0005F4FAA4|nr:PREDICTED: uncharacterized protein LOC105570318 [Vollenhovia emeryi]
MNGKIKCGYCGCIMNSSCMNIQQHKCFENYQDDVHLLHVDENQVVRIVPRYDENSDINTTIPTDVVVPVENDSKTSDNDEILIELVFQRPALWNHKLPLQDRTNLKKDALWLEVSNGMGGGKATIKWVKNRWKDLRDAYVKARKKIKAYIPSGCDTETANKLRKSSFRFYEQMQFLETTLVTETTVSSLSIDSSSKDSSSKDSNFRSDSSCSDSIDLHVDSLKTSYESISPKMTLNEPFTPSNTFATLTSKAKASKNKRKRLNSTEQDDIQEGLLKALCQPLNQPDAVDGILLKLGEGLRRLSYRERSKLEIQWLRELMEVEEQHNN